MRILRNILLALLLIIVVVVIGGFVFFWDTTRGPIPQTRGELSVQGLQAQVEILRDEWGIPHIYASNPHDLFFAQGYVQAQDRWWQMEFYRHIGSGTISELTGMSDDARSNDVFIRTAGWRRAAERDAELLGDEARAALESFAEGVNAYITNRPADKLALEYRVLGLNGVRIAIEPWTIVDSIVWGKVMAWDLTATYGDELVRQALFASVGEEMAADYMPQYPYGEDGYTTIVHPEDLPIEESTLTNPTLSARRIDGAFGMVMAGGLTPDVPIAGRVNAAQDTGIGSNNWVATGSMTDSGLALLANDMHLGVQQPGIWFLIGLHCLPVTDACPYDLTGFALTPTPSIVVGHNASIAWAMTNVGADVQDLYALDWNPDDPTQYRWNGEWRSATIIEETIRFGDGEPSIPLRIRETHLGPVINDNQIDDSGALLGFNTEDPLVMRWTALDPNHQFDALLGFARATNWEEFRAAASIFEIPSQNLAFADVRGNIGYQTPGLIPIRPAGHDGLTPYFADSDEDAWQGYIPFDSLPRVLNPERNYIATANQAVVPLEYYDQLAEQLGGDPANYVLSQDWSYGQRGERIEQLLQETAPHNLLTFQGIQLDTKDLNAERIVPYLEQLTFEGSIAEARDFLTAWDKMMSAESGQAALYAYFMRRLLQNTFSDQLPEDMNVSNRDGYAITLLMDDPTNVWWDDTSTPDVQETRDDIFTRSFAEAVNEITADLGNNPAEWSWGELHGITYVSQPLGVSGISIIEDMVNRTALGFGGGTEIVNATSWNLASGSFFATSQPSERLIVDLSEFDNSLVILPSGQSGHPYSAHYDNMIETYRTGGYVPLSFSRNRVEQRTADRLVLSPAEAG